jgi:hypothetical protein
MAEQEMPDVHSVVQFFVDDSYEYVCRHETAEEAMRVFQLCCTSVGARIGTTKRVLITDQWDFTNAHWEFGQGLVFPPPSPPEQA